MKLQHDEINYIVLKKGVNIKVNVICNSRFSLPFYGWNIKGNQLIDFKKT